MGNAYRTDIDGLRAVSVILVILFHLGVPGFSGGFVGVDVFFVISGFLITELIFDGIQRETFTFANFYERRIRRILPMLITIVLVSAVAGYFLLIPGDYKVLGESARAALLAWSNFYFLNHTGYFDIPAQTMPLLHTWSLGVEEQFYLVWPAALVFGAKLFGRSQSVRITAFVVIILVSFLSSLLIVGHNPKLGFYSPFTRAWELAFGGLLTLLPRPRQSVASELMPVIGLAAIAFSTWTLSAAAPFPRLNAIPPTLGAALILYPQRTATQTLLGASPFRLVGLISYSLYLWHWPLIVFWRLYNNDQPTSSAIANLALIIVAILLSVLSWRFIEQPARRVKVRTSLLIGSAATISLLAIVAVSTIVKTNGFPQRLPQQIAAIDSKDKMWAWTCPQSASIGVLANGSMSVAPSCGYGADWATASHHAIIWGDSLAEHLAPILDVAGRKTDTSIALAYACAAITQNGAPRYISSDLVPHYEDWCDAARDRVLDLVTSNNEIDVVLLSTSWSFLWPLLNPHSEREARKTLQSGLEDLVERIIAANKRPIIIADAPAYIGSDPASCVIAISAVLLRRKCPNDPAFINISAIPGQVETHEMLKKLVSLHPNAAIIDPMDFLCDRERCKAIVAGELIYRDAVHLRRNLDAGMIRMLEAGMQVDRILAGDPTKNRGPATGEPH